MTIEIARASPSAMPAVRELLDAVFGHPRGDPVQMARRLPTVLSDHNASNVFVAARHGRVIGVVATRPFAWIVGDERWRAAMVGLVATAEDQRGRGVASGLLEEVERALRAGGISFAVLWTQQPGFYERLGWCAADVGVLGEASPLPEVVGGEALPLDAVFADRLDRVRRRSETHRVERAPADWFAVPSPATEVRAVVAGPAGEPHAYALVGLTADAGYVYELVGDAASFADAWAATRSLRSRLLVNDSRSSRSRRWLDAHEDVSWREQRLAMWLPLDTRAAGVEVSGWHVPWLDRI